MHAYYIVPGFGYATDLLCLHFLHPPGTLETTSTVNMTFISQSALDAEDSLPPIPPKLFLDDEFDDDPPPPIPPKLFLDNKDYSLPIPYMKLPKSRGPQQTGKIPSSQWQTILVLLNGCGGQL